MGSVENFLIMTWALLPRKKIYKDDLNSHTYVCDAEHWTALTEAKWRVQKLFLDVDWDVEEIKRTDNYDNLATDLATVQALTYK